MVASNLITALIFLLFANPAWAVLTEVAGQRKNVVNDGSVDSSSSAFTSNVTSGNLLLVMGVAGGSTTGPIVTDSRSTTYTVQSFITGTARVFVAYGMAPSSGSCSVTVNPTGSFSRVNFVLAEFSGQHPTPIDVALVSNTGTSTTPSVSITPLSSGTLVAGILHQSSGTLVTITENPSWTLIGEREDGTLGLTHSGIFLLTTATTPQTLSWTLGSSVAWEAIAVVLKAADATTPSGGGGTMMMRKRAYIGQ